jgi:hypothetical protein
MYGLLATVIAQRLVKENGRGNRLLPLVMYATLE